MRELIAALRDFRECGDLIGHLRSWWRAVTGQVDPEEMVEPSVVARGILDWWNLCGYDPEEAR